MTQEELDEQEFQELMKVETPIIQEFNGKRMYFFKNKTFRDKYPFIEPIKREPIEQLKSKSA